jgi:hypothetical protein
MWMSSSSVAERELAAVELGLDAVEPAEQRVAVGLADDPAPPSIVACARDCSTS